MRFLVDESLSPRLSALLIEAGHDAIHVRDIGLRSALDRDVLARAKSDGRGLITADTDFGTILALEGAAAPRDPLPSNATAKDRAACDGSALEPQPDRRRLATGCIAVFEDDRMRVRDLPIDREA